MEKQNEIIDFNIIDFNNTYILEEVNYYPYGSYGNTFETIGKIEDITDLIGFLIYCYSLKSKYFIKSNDDLYLIKNYHSLKTLIELQKTVEDYYNPKN